jgi:TonB family protein
MDMPARACAFRGVCHLAALFCLGLSGVLAGQAHPASEPEVKAAYLYNFAHSARWPEANAPAANSPFVIGVTGEDEVFLKGLRTIIDGRTVESHPMIAKVVTQESEMRYCQLVFFHSTASRRQPTVIGSLQSAAVLLVGEDPSFLQQGGMINLYPQNGRIRFEVNRQALDRAGIRLSSALLELAKADDSSPRTAASGKRQLRVSPPPSYPELARRLRISGMVHLQAVVRRDGTVIDVKVLGGNPLLAEALSHAVMSWKYDPAARETVEQVDYSFVQP